MSYKNDVQGNQWNTYLAPERTGGEIRSKREINNAKMSQKSKIKAKIEKISHREQL